MLLFVYLSPEGSTVYENFEVKTNGVDLFEEKILSTIVASYPDASIFLAGDLNSRTSNMPDFIINDNVDFIFEDNYIYIPDNFEMERKSKDQSENAFRLGFN